MTPAVVPSCSSCGAPLPVDLFSTVITCESCSATQSVDAALREQLNAYAGDAARLIRAELMARFHRAFYAQNDLAAPWVLIGVIGFALMAVIGFFAGVAASSGNLLLSQGLAVAALWSASTLSFAWGWKIMFSVPAPEAMAVERAARCSRCGDVRVFSAAQTTAKCLSCEGTLFVPTDVAAALLLEVEGKSRASIAQRRATLARTEKSLDRYVNPLVAVVVLGVPVLGGGLIALSLAGGPRVSFELYCALMIAAPSAAVPLFVLPPIRARSHRMRIDALADRLIAHAARQRATSDAASSAP